MYRTGEQEIFVVDGHMHLWDASPENWRNQYGEGWIRCFYDYQTALSPSGPSRSSASTGKTPSSTISS